VADIYDGRIPISIQLINLLKQSGHMRNSYIDKIKKHMHEYDAIEIAKTCHNIGIEFTAKDLYDNRENPLVLEFIEDKIRSTIILKI
jgi:hypothetical protein